MDGECIKVGKLSKRGMGYLYKPWSIRIFRLYSGAQSGHSDGGVCMLTYETETGVVKGKLKVQEPPAHSIVLPQSATESSSSSTSSGIITREHAFKAYVRKFENDGSAISTDTKECVIKYFQA